MKKTWIQRGAVGLIGLLAVAAAAVLVAAELGERKMQRHIEVAVAPLDGRADAAAVERGHYLFRSRGCTECHGHDGAGKIVIDAPNGLHVRAPNISPGPGSAVAGYRVEDWDRAVRHGVHRDGRPLLVMPSEDYARWTDADLVALVAYLRGMPPVPGGPAEFRLPLPMKVLYAVGLMRDAAQKIDHRLPPPVPLAAAATSAYGAYVAQSCIGCHGPTLTGGRIAGAPPEWPAAARLRPGEGSALARYSSAQAFAQMLRSGRRPDGSAVSPVMPFGALREMNDTDVEAVYTYLTGLPPSVDEPGGSAGL